MTNASTTPLMRIVTRGTFHQTTVVILLFSQLWLLIVGGPFLVQCQEPGRLGGGEHQAIELAHIKSCGDDDSALSEDLMIPASTPDLVSSERCVDTPLSSPVVLRQEDRSSFENVPVLLAYQVAVLPDLAEAQPHISGASGSGDPAHISSPDSPESLVHSIILLI